MYLPSGNHVGDHRLKYTNGYSIVKSWRTRYGGHDKGTVILVNCSIHFQYINLNTNLQAKSVKIWLSEWYTIVSLYSPHIDLKQAEI